MSLRARLLVAYLAVVVVLGTAMFVVVHGQRGHLVGQVDKQLNAVRPFVRPASSGDFPVVAPQDQASGTTGAGVPPLQGPISDLYVAEFDADGNLVVVLSGLLLDDAPDIDVADVDDLPTDGERTLSTVEGVAGESRFRVAIQATPEGTWSVVALPLDEVDDAVQRLIVALAIGVALVLLMMALTMWWVFRLGLRPMARITDAADEIAAGRRERRVEYDDPRTEVGRLGRALNGMLDQRDRNEDKLRQFVADASHELRTPLTSIRGGLDLVLDEGMAPAQRDDVLRRVRSESRRMHDLVEDLLLLASLDSGRPLRAEPVDLVPVVHDAADDARALQPGRPVIVEPADGAGGPLVVTGDEMRLRQVVAGLVHNALAHTPTDAALRISARRDGDAVVLAVADDGPGLSPEHAATVFDRFTRGDASRSRHAGGAGLGLAIARSIVEAHGGTLELTTAPGAGCTFSIRLS
jgi:two-component system, OmpR family, sensor kinase